MKIFYPTSFECPYSIINSNELVRGNDSAHCPKCIFNIQRLNSISIHGIKELRRIKSREKKIIIVLNNLLCINHYRYSSFEHLYGIKEGRGGGVHKLKYRKPIIIKKDAIKTKEIRDNYLKEHSRELIESCQNNHIKPKTSLYPNSSWIKLKEQYPREFKKFQECIDYNSVHEENINDRSQIVTQD